MFRMVIDAKVHGPQALAFKSSQSGFERQIYFVTESFLPAEAGRRPTGGGRRTIGDAGTKLEKNRRRDRTVPDGGDRDRVTGAWDGFAPRMLRRVRRGGRISLWRKHKIRWNISDAIRAGRQTGSGFGAGQRAAVLQGSGRTGPDFSSPARLPEECACGSERSRSSLRYSRLIPVSSRGARIP